MSAETMVAVSLWILIILTFMAVISGAKITHNKLDAIYTECLESKDVK